MRFLSLDHCRKNRSRLAGAVGLVANEDGSTYAEAVHRLRGFPCGPGSPNLSYEDSGLAQFAFQQGLFPEKVGHDASARQDRVALEALYRDGMSLIYDASPELLQLVTLVTTDVVFVQSSRIGGGSGSHLPGLIGVTPGTGWDALDMAKCLVHEATHLNTFLCDMLHMLFIYPADVLEHDEHRVLSAVRVGEMRPLDKALHSALVAVPVMYFEELVGRSDVRSEFLEPLRECTVGLNEKSEVLTPYGRAVVADLTAYVQTLDPTLVKAGLQALDEDCLVPAVA